MAGGVGTHEWMLPTPERVDLAGRCVMPAFTDSHVHFPTWALARHDVHLESADSVASALALVGGHPRRGGTWLRGTGWRDASWPDTPTAAALDAVTGSTPAALWSKDYHSLWLNTAGLGVAGGDLDVPGGVVERDGDGRAHRNPARGVGLAVPGALRQRHRGRMGRRRRATGSASRTRAGSQRFTTRTAGSARRRSSAGSTSAKGCRCASGSHSPPTASPEFAALPLRSRIGDDFLRLGYLKTFMDGTLGSQTASMLDGSGVEITSREELEEIVRDGGAGRLAGRGARDRRPREPQRPRRLRGDPRDLAATRPPPPDRARPVPRPRRHSSVRRARRRLLDPALARAVRPGPGRALLGRPARRAVTRSGASGTPAPSSSTAPTHPSRSSTRWPGSAPASCARSTTARLASRGGAHGRAGDRRIDRHAGLARGRRAPSGAAPPRVPRRPRRALARSVHLSRRRARVGRDRVDDGRRAVGVPTAPLGLAGAGGTAP